MRLGIVGAGAFGSAMARVLSETQEVTLWGRNAANLDQLRGDMPQTARLTDHVDDLQNCDVMLVALPAQTLRDALTPLGDALQNKTLISLAKGVDRTSLAPAYAALAPFTMKDRIGQLSGPAFADDLARGLPTAMTLAMPGAGAPALQKALSTPHLRIYLSDDLIGVALGGAVKNIIALAAGAVIGAGLGESARAAIIARGYAEMRGYALHKGAAETTLAGLSGLGDLVLTATSERSRNYRAGLALGQNKALPSGTVEGAATTHAVLADATAQGLDLPLTATLADLLDGRVDVGQAMTALLARPLTHE